MALKNGLWRKIFEILIPKKLGDKPRSPSQKVCYFNYTVFRRLNLTGKDKHILKKENLPERLKISTWDKRILDSEWRADDLPQAQLYRPNTGHKFTKSKTTTAKNVTIFKVKIPIIHNWVSRKNFCIGKAIDITHIEGVCT